MKSKRLKKVFIDILFLITNLLLFFYYITWNPLVRASIFGLNSIYLAVGLKFFLKKENLTLYSITWLGTTILALGMLVYDAFYVSALVNISTSIIVGTVMVGNGLNKICQFIFMLVVYSYIAYLYIIGIPPSEVFSTYSHNHISVTLLYTTILFYLSYSSSEIKNKHYSIMPALICYILCVLSLGRSGIISAAFLLTFLAILKYQHLLLRENIPKKVFAFLFALGFVYSIYRSIGYFFEAGYFFQFEKRSLESEGRSIIIHTYLDHLDGINLLIGNGYKFFEEVVGKSPHISYLSWHNSFGIAGLLLMLYTLFAILKYFARNRYYMVLFSVILIRSSTDDVLFTSGIMFGVLFVYFLLKSEYQVTKGNSLDYSSFTEVK